MPSDNAGSGAGPLALGLDLGTSGVRVVAVDPSGEIRAEATRDYPLETPRPGWTQQDPDHWREAVMAALAEVVEAIGADAIAGIGLSGQMHGMVPLDRDGQPIRPAILWNDQRTGEDVEALEARFTREELVRRTGNRGVTGFQLPKILWLRRSEPEAFERLSKVLLPKDYVGYLLTGIFAAEPSDASGVGCMDITTKRWDTDMLADLELDPELFPEIISSDARVGDVLPSVAEATGLTAGTPVYAGGGDNAAAAIGLGITRRNPRVGSLSLGTSGVIFQPLEAPRPDPEGRVHLFCHADGGYHLLGVTLSAAGSLQWFHDTLMPGMTFADLVALAEESEPGAGGVSFRPYLSGERTPHMDPDLRGSFSGLSLATKQGDLVRAVLEGVAFSLADALEIMRPLAESDRLLTTGGGARSSLWLQIVADVLRVELASPKQNQGAAYGAALLALKGSGAVGDFDRLMDAVGETESVVEPGDGRAYQEARQRYLQPTA